MIRYIIIILVWGLSNCDAQTNIKYYKDEFMHREVSQEKAKFSRTITHSPDGLVTTELKDIKKNLVIDSQTFSGNEPYGVWIYKKGKEIETLDYNFKLIYSDEKCERSINLKELEIKDPFQDVDSLNYKAPQLIGGDTMHKGGWRVANFIGTMVEYPTRARQRDLQGTVYVGFEINTEGNVENIHVKRGIHILLDKEAARVVRKLKFSQPAMLNGQNQAICVIFPLKFALQYRSSFQELFKNDDSSRYVK